jgi:hypothetical protein
MSLGCFVWLSKHRGSLQKQMQADTMLEAFAIIAADKAGIAPCLFPA